MCFIALGCPQTQASITYTLVNVPVVITSFFPFCRMKEDFMELYLVREQFQRDIIGKVNC